MESKHVYTIFLSRFRWLACSQTLRDLSHSGKEDNNVLFLILVDSSWPLIICIVIETSKINTWMVRVSWRSWIGHVAFSRFKLSVQQNMTVFVLLNSVTWFVNSQAMFGPGPLVTREGDILPSYFAGCIDMVYMCIPCLCMQSNNNCHGTSCSCFL